VQKNSKLVLWLIILLFSLVNLILLITITSDYYDVAIPSHNIRFYLPILATAFIIVVSIFGAIGSSLTRENILTNYTRARIYAFIRSNPGIHFSEIVRKLELSNGQTNWHLICLKQFDMIRSIKTSQYLMYYPNEGNFAEIVESIDQALILKSETRNQIYMIIKQKPAITQNDLKRIVKISQSTLAYHLAILEQENLIYTQKKGRIRNYFPQDAS